MADGITFATERIKILEAEIARLKEYVRQSEKLLAEGWLGPADGAAESKNNTDKSGKPLAVHHLRSPSNGSGTDGADTERHVLTQPTPNDLGNSSVRLNGETRDRTSIFRRVSK